MASTIQLKTGTGSAVPSSLTQGEVAINVDNGLIYYGSGSVNSVKQLESFTNITASGGISASGTIIANSFVGSFTGGVTGDATGLTGTPTITVDNINVSGDIIHNGDTDTKISLTNDDINIKVGNVNMLDFTENAGSQDEITFNEEGADLDVRMEGDSDQNLFFLDAGNDKVGIGTNSPGEKLEVVGNISASSTVTANDFIGAPIHLVTHAWFSNTTSKFPSGDLSHLMNGNSNFGWADRAWNDSVTKTEVFDNNQLNGVNDHNKGVPIQHNVTDIQLTGYMRASDASDVTEMNYWIFKGNKVNGSGPTVTFLASASSATVGTNYNEVYITGSTGLQADAGDLIFVFANTDVGGTGTGRNVRGMYTVTAKTR